MPPTFIVNECSPPTHPVPRMAWHGMAWHGMAWQLPLQSCRTVCHQRSQDDEPGSVRWYQFQSRHQYQCQYQYCSSAYCSAALRSCKRRAQHRASILFSGTAFVQAARAIPRKHTVQQSGLCVCVFVDCVAFHCVVCTVLISIT